MKELFFTTAIIPLDDNTLDEERVDEVMGKLYESFTTLADEYDLEILNVETNDFSQFVQIEVVGDMGRLASYGYDLAHNILPLDGETLSYIGNTEMIENCSRDIIPYE